MRVIDARRYTPASTAANREREPASAQTGPPSVPATPGRAGMSDEESRSGPILTAVFGEITVRRSGGTVIDRSEIAGVVIGGVVIAGG